MDEGTLRLRLWQGFARLQTLLGGHSHPGAVLERDGLVASVVPDAPESPTLNAAVAIDPDNAPDHLGELHERYRETGIRRWGLWLDGSAHRAHRALAKAGLVVTSASPGMGAALDDIAIGEHDAYFTDLGTVGRVNDAAYGNFDARLARTLKPLRHDGSLRAYATESHGEPAAVALALYHEQDCGVSFVATVPRARRRGLARQVMWRVLDDARSAGCTTTTLQATDVGQRLYAQLGYRHLCEMQLWERRP